MVMSFSDYRSYLKSVLADRISKNPAYSLRALSRHVGVAPSTLSEVLSGKKNLSPDKAELIGRKLELNSHEREYFTALVQFELARTEELKISISEKLRSLNPQSTSRDLSLDVFQAISEWYHIPIVVYCSLPNAKVDLDFLTNVLDVSRYEIEAAVDRLIRLGLLAKNEAGFLRQIEDDLVAKSLQPNVALRSFHRQMLGRAQDSLESQTAAEKFIGSETVAFDRDDLPKVELALEECFKRILDISKISNRQNSVYHLGIQFFQLGKGVVS